MTHADIPVPSRVVARHDETDDVATLCVRPVTGDPPDFAPAQFSMIGVLGVGEVPISISSSADDHVAHSFTIRRSGAVTNALVDREIGDLVTVRGPFGRSWDLERVGGRHAVFVAGGIGLAPLRAAIEAVVGQRLARRVSVLVGARSPGDQIYSPWLRRLERAGAGVLRAVDDLGDGSPHDVHVGFVTELVPEVIGEEPVAAYVCGPDAMMSAAVAVLRSCGVADDDIEVTLERNMQCGAGWCGHCQLGPHLLCRDGPVLGAGVLADLLEREEL